MVKTGRTPHGVRGLKCFYGLGRQWMGKRRTPHGVRGLKYSTCTIATIDSVSHPAWGAWIEIFIVFSHTSFTNSRTPHGVRGLKSA